jgi:membrane fusion protein, multidrug efflux system
MSSRYQIILLMLAMALVVLVGCAKPAAKATVLSVVPVTVTKSIVKTVPIEVKAIGRVKAISSVSVRAQFGGQLKEVHFKEGEYVTKDQKLFTIDPRVYEAAVKLANANLAKSKAVLQGAIRILERVEKLSGGAVSQEEIDVARTAVDTARAVVSADEAALNTAQVQESYTIIKSPLDGRTGGLLVTAGNLVSSNDANPLVVVNQVSPIHVAFSLPEQQLLEVMRANKEKPLKVMANLRNGEKEIEGRLAFIDNAIDPTTGTVQLKAEFINADQKLWPGQFLDVVVTIRERSNSVVVQNAAIQSGQQGQYVYVVMTNKKVELRPVTVAFERGGESVISRGLNDGETVVLEGQLRLAPGAQIEVKDLSDKKEQSDKKKESDASSESGGGKK